MPSILITQCLQRDFIDPILPHEPLPNLLHVGHAESLRLLGHDPFSGPIAQLMSWARAQSADALDIIHIRDWHDKDDPRQRDHLKQFGEHCIGGTPGAQLILDLDAELGKRPNECAVDSIALNDFQDTKLAEKLDSIRARTVVGASRPHPPLAESAQTSGAMGPGRPHDVPLRIGVVGVWTEAKVSFLLYDLKTRYGVHEIATCSALTASASRAQHFNALEQLSRILGVRVFDTVGEFATWLKPGSTSLLPVATKKFGHHVAVKGASAAAPPLSAEDHDIVGYLFRDSSSVTLEPLSGGFSGALVFRATSQDALQHQQAPSVVKLGPSKLIGAERVAFERVEQILGNNAPSVRGFAELGPRAGIKYSFAAMGQGKVRSLKSLFEHNRPVEQLETVIRSVFGDVLRPFYSAARYDRLPLLEHYRFSPEFAPGVRKNVHAIVADRAGDDRLEFADGTSAMNICAFYENFLPSYQAEPGESHFVSYVHGDLNGANILVDGRDNVWVIDFFHTAPGHVLKDLAKLENDLLYIFTPLEDRAMLAEGLRITRTLREVEDLRGKLPEKISGVTSEPLVRAWAIIRTLREFAAEYCQADRHPVQMDIALLRYAVHTLSFDESSPMQKEWALAASCGLAEDIVSTRTTEQKMRVDWVDFSSVGSRKIPGKLGLTICPGRRDRGRDLAADLNVLSAEKVSRVVCLMTDSELEWAGVRHLSGALAARNIQFRQVPVLDQHAPDLESAQGLVRWILAALESGENVVIQCLGGLGRSGTIAACLLTACGADAEKAIGEIRRCRGPRAIEVVEQAKFVAKFVENRS